MSTTPEGKIQSKIMELLVKQGLFAFRVNNAPVWDRHLNSGYGSYRTQGKWAMPGLSDVIVVHNGLFIGCEIKTPTGKLSADQILFKRRLERVGGRYYVLRSVEDARLMLTELNVVKGPS